MFPRDISVLSILSSMCSPCFLQVIIRVNDRLAALWPFLGIVAEVVILITVIFIYEKRSTKVIGTRHERSFLILYIKCHKCTVSCYHGRQEDFLWANSGFIFGPTGLLANSVFFQG